MYPGSYCVLQVTPNDEVRGIVVRGANVMPNAVVEEAFQVGGRICWLVSLHICWLVSSPQWGPEPHLF